ncbi:MAG: sulfotransferase [Chloroflexia bacterium]|nr:sulfotransferase [Chloroflexia bacterium]
MPDLSEKMIFVIGSPRSGSTLLQRMLDSHSQIFGCPEPHILTPLAHLGYYETVEKAPYDHLRAVDAIRGFVDKLPRGEEDYLDACRAYTDTLYGRRMQGSGQDFFLDKTPAYALVLPFIARLYPRAKYVVLTRHPIAIFASYAKSFFENDYQAAHDFNPLLERYVPAIARFLRREDRPIYHVRYEDLVRDPENELRRIFEFIGVPFEAGAIEYGRHEHDSEGLGDPTGVEKHTRPVTTSIAKWAGELAADPQKEALVREMIARLDPDDVATWGYDKAALFEPLEQGDLAPQAQRRRRKPDKHTLERWLLLKLRKNIHHNWFGRIVKRVRFVCDVLLR